MNIIPVLLSSFACLLKLKDFFFKKASVTYSVSLPHVGGGPQAEGPVDDQGVVDVDEEGQLLLPTQ